MEDHLPDHASFLRHRRPLMLAAAALVALCATVFVLSHGPAPAAADQNANNTICRGHVGKGAAEADDPTSTQVGYTFACSGPITGYQIQPDHAATSIETEVFALDRASHDVVATDSFSCGGDIPGFGVNCVGTYGGDWRVVNGRFAIDGDLCAEPRVDALLTVMYATKDSAGKVTQAIAGPFELGRPRGCPKSARGGKTRIPDDSADTPATY
jgi:hypothetical protein